MNKENIRQYKLDYETSYEYVKRLQKDYTLEGQRSHIGKYIDILLKQLKEKEEMIIIMEKYFELISDLGFDYDGFNTVENLKGLIDAMVRYARLGRVCNTTEPIYESNGKKHNILGKDILDKEK